MGCGICESILRSGNTRAIGPRMLRNPHRTLKASPGCRLAGIGCAPHDQGAEGEHEDLFIA